jgi:GT2 family glycosyltransferase
VNQTSVLRFSSEGPCCTDDRRYAPVPDRRDTGTPTPQQSPDQLTMSVIVCTVNRAQTLETVCLTSLAAQAMPGHVELIVCDSSSDTATEAVVRQWGSVHSDWPCTYVHSTRRCLCSQRNLAVRDSRGDIVLFVDDDLELLPGALVALMQAFQQDSTCQYGGFECVLVSPPHTERSEPGVLRGISRRSFARFWGLPTAEGPKTILASGYNAGGDPIDRETAAAVGREACQVVDVEWMSGCCMAFRASLFREGGICFDERLARFGGYCLAEDVVVSLAVRRATGLRLGQCSLAQAIHWDAPGGRGDERSRWAAQAYNHRTVWQLDAAPTLRRRFNWLRAQMGLAVLCLLHRRTDWLHGLADGWRAIRLDETQRCLPR